jgi:hemoglobin
MSALKKDIKTEEDIKLLVNNFYSKVSKNILLAPFFNQSMQTNWEKHLAVMYDFWSSVLLGTMKYTGLPFPKHMSLPIEKIHFDQWLKLFFDTVEEHFEGPVAEEAKRRASLIAKTFQFKLGILK